MGRNPGRWSVLAAVWLVLLSGLGQNTLSAFSATTANAGNSFASAASFRVTQLAGTAGCISDTGTSGACTDATAPMATAGWVTVSPDNKHVYVATRATGQAVVVFTRNQTTGALTQASCISRTGNGGVCATEALYSNPFAITFSPDGKNAYVSDATANIIFAYSRNTTTGDLTPLGTRCVSETGNSGACTDVMALTQPNAPAFTSDGAYLYVPSRTSNAIAVFSRDTTTGVLTQLAGVSGCISSSTAGCTTGRVMTGTTSLAISPDDGFVYSAAIGDNAVDVFSRNTTTGTLSQLAGTNGCVSATGNTGNCVQGVQLSGTDGIVVSPDGRNVYASAWSASGTVLSFSRDSTTGVITQLAGTAGCMNLTGSPCATGRILSYANFLDISPDGQNVYIPSAKGDTTTDGIGVLRRDATTGELSQDSGAAGCQQETASSSCTDATALVYPIRVTVAPDGKDVYAASYTSGSVTTFNRSR
jgi:6-phosphogluconolactonase (cycloisomerase 2 family)